MCECTPAYKNVLYFQQINSLTQLFFQCMQEEKNSAVERAEVLQAQMNELHADLEKLRKEQASKLHERVCALTMQQYKYW